MEIGDFEKILPGVIAQHLPVGCKGILLAGLLAAFMSTFVSTVNSGVAYIVNDVYRRYFRPNEEPRHYVRWGYFWSLIVILLGIAFGYTSVNVHSVTRWIVSALVPAFVVPNVLKWHWWRFNGHGFWAGMAGGTAAALAIPALYPELRDVWLFMAVLGVSGVASVGACLATAPEPDEVLMEFYRTIRPWGRWRPIMEKCRAQTPALQPNRDAGRDAMNVLLGIVWQIAMVAAPIYLVLKQWSRFAIWSAVFLGLSAVLKVTWYDRLGRDEGYLPRDR